MGERLGKRNLHYNRRHRTYGKELIMYDVDCVEVHHQTKEAVALVETKYGLIKNIDLNEDQITTHLKMAEKLEIPLFCLIYYPFNEDGDLMGVEVEYQNLSHIQFYVVPVNIQSKRLVPKQRRMTEQEWVEVLYKLRGIPLNHIPTGLCRSWKEVNIPFVMLRP